MAVFLSCVNCISLSLCVWTECVFVLIHCASFVTRLQLSYLIVYFMGNHSHSIPLQALEVVRHWVRCWKPSEYLMSGLLLLVQVNKISCYCSVLFKLLILFLKLLIIVLKMHRMKLNCCHCLNNRFWMIVDFSLCIFCLLRFGLLPGHGTSEQEIICGLFFPELEDENDQLNVREK